MEASEDPGDQPLLRQLANARHALQLLNDSAAGLFDPALLAAHGIARERRAEEITGLENSLASLRHFRGLRLRGRLSS